ncbi:hypothetical protein OXX80_001016 [Metschnikowia pulcherrima]
MVGKVAPRSHFIVTGGAGFIGSHMVDFLLDSYPASTVTCLDKLSYATHNSLHNLQSAQNHNNFRFEKIDLAESHEDIRVILRRKIDEYDAITIFNFAAESCVDQSFDNPIFFTKNNILATQNVLEAARIIIHENPSYASRIQVVHISTDEVYGEQGIDEEVDETSPLHPSNPYAATKAACDLIIEAYVKSYKLNVAIVRGNNVYGPRQFPEKLIATTLEKLKYAKPDSGIEADQRIIIHGDGSHRRRYLHVRDFVRAVDFVSRNSRKSHHSGEVYNVGTNDECTNKALVEMICRNFMKIVHGADIQDFFKFYYFGKNRLYNDSRYSIDTGKMLDLGWSAEVSLADGITELIKEVMGIESRQRV